MIRRRGDIFVVMGDDKNMRRVQAMHVLLQHRYRLVLVQTEDETTRNLFEVFRSGSPPRAPRPDELHEVASLFPSMELRDANKEFATVNLSDSDVVHAAFMEDV